MQTKRSKANVVDIYICISPQVRVLDVVRAAQEDGAEDHELLHLAGLHQVGPVKKKDRNELHLD